MKTTAKITAVLLVLALAGSVSAEVITIEVTGVVDLIVTDGGLALDGSVGLGSVMTGFTTYDTDTANLGDSITGLYNLISISMTIGNYTFTHDPMSVNPPLFGVFTVDPVYIASSDALRFDGTVYIDGSPKIYDDIAWSWTYLELFNLGTSSSEYVPTAALPDLDSWPDLSVFDVRRKFRTQFLGEGSDYFDIRGEVTSLTVIPKPPKTYYVDAADGNDNNDGLSPETPFATIQKAIDTSYSGDTVLVADGTYTGPGNRDIDFLGKAITVRSESGPENCIIDCNGTEDDSHRGFYFYNGEDANSVLDGFTITGGYMYGSSWSDHFGGGIDCTGSSPTITNCIISGNSGKYGGGISCEWESNPTITNCTISGNSAGHGGGIYCSWQSHPTITNCTINGNSAGHGGGIYCSIFGSPTIINCIITDNTAFFGGGGGIFCWESSQMISNCTITDNEAKWGDGGGICCWGGRATINNCTISRNLAEDGGGIYCTNGSLTVTNCTISDNSGVSDGLVPGSGGGIYCGDSNLVITRCTISGNLGDNGGGISCDECNTTMINCIISGNSGQHLCGGIFFWKSDAEVINCTISGNFGPRGGGISSWESDLAITNCILWNNADSEIEDSAVVSYSDIRGGWPGEGNINVDPCFVVPGYWADANDPNIVIEPNDPNAIWVDGDYHLFPDSPCIDAGDPNYVAEPNETDIDGNPRVSGDAIDMGAYEAMVSCFGVNHVKLGTKAGKKGKKGNKVEVKGTFDPASPIDFAVDDVTYTIDDGLDYMLTFIIPAGSFEAEGKPDKQKFRFHSAKGSQPGIKAKFDFLKCKFELKVKGLMDTSEITADTLVIVLQAGANLVEEVVQVQAKPKHLEFKREPKLNCCQMLGHRFDGSNQ